LKKLCIVALLQLFAAGAEAAICTSQASFSWPAIGAGSWSCGAGGAGDLYVVAAGHTVTVTGSLTQSASASAGIRVEAGGTLLVQGRFVLTLGGAGLDCQAGSACTLEGPGYRSLAQTVPAYLSGPTPQAYGTVGGVVPCPDGAGAPDCAARPERARILPSGATPAGVGSIATGDILCFGDTDPADDVSYPDAGFCYEVANDPSASPPYAIEIDVRQSPSLRAAAGYPLGLRLLRQGTVLDSGGAPAGGRSLQVQAGTLSENRELVGRWLRFADATGAPEATAYKISETTDGGTGPDTLRIGDVRGFASAHPVGRAVFVDYGWSLGDPFAVWAPLRIRSATPLETDSQVVLAGTHTVRRVVFDAIGTPSDAQTLTGVLLFKPTTALTAFEDVWVADPAGPPAAIAVMFDGTPAFTFRRFQQTGGTSSSAHCVPYDDTCADYLHVFGLRGPAVDARFEDIGVRHHGDDVFLDANAWGAKLRLRRVHAAFVSRYAASGSLLDMSSFAASIDARDLVCDDCTSPPIGSSAAADVVNQLGNTTGSISGLLVWGTRGGAACDGPIVCNDVTVIGSSGSSGAMVGGKTDHVVVRDVHTTGGTLVATPARPLELRRAWIRDSSFGNQQGINFPSGAGNAVTIESTVFQDVNGPETSFLLNGGTPDEPLVLRDVSAVWTGAHTLDRFLTSYGGDHTLVTLDGVLVQGLNGPGELVLAADLDEVAKPSPSCFFDDTAPWSASQASFVPGTWIASNALGPNDPPRAASYPFTTGLDCGATGPVGVPRERWMHGKAGLAPEHLGPADGDEDAVGDAVDLCPAVPDPAQADTDGDGIGDLCDAICIGGATTSITSVNLASQSISKPIVLAGTGFGPNAQVVFGSTLGATTWGGPGLLTAAVPSLPVGSQAALTVVNPEGCRSLESVVLTIAPSTGCGLIGPEALVALGAISLRRRRRS
jgi:hypothetical protein